MAIGKNLFKEKTNVGVKASTTFNAPGNYKAPYGKTVVKVGGRGATGNPGNPGNPSNPGNYTPGNYVPGNPTTYVYNTTTFGPKVWGFGGGSNPFSQSFVTAPGPAPRGGSGQNTYYGQSYSYSSTYATYYNAGAFSNPGSFTPGNPGNAGNAGTAGANATIGGVYFPGGAAGNAGPAGSPGGAGGTAPTVSPATTTIEYSEAGFTVTVPSGGYVDLNNL